MSSRATQTPDEAPLEKTTLLGEFVWFLKHEKRWWFGFIVLILSVLSLFVVFTDNSHIIPIQYKLF